MNQHCQKFTIHDSVEALCQKYGVDPWHARNSFRRPRYQQLTCEIVGRIADRNTQIVEIGCGIGDILVNLAAFGFRNLHGLERDLKVFEVAQERASQRGFTFIHYKNISFPASLAIRPNILLLVNCMYFDEIRSKPEFGNELRKWMSYNGEPDAFLVETIDNSYKSLVHTRYPNQPTEFNPYCRISDEDMKSFFPEYNIYRSPSSEETRVPKTLYLITQQEAQSCLDRLMEVL